MPIPQTFDEAFTRVKELVAIFKQNESVYTGPRYNEADARKDFIDKFWIALGWDVNHEQQTDPYKQDVKVERGVATSEFRKLDRQIDNLVYELYDLTPEEIAILEGAGH